jgi:hypothetical protein
MDDRQPNPGLPSDSARTLVNNDPATSWMTLKASDDH